MRPSAARDAVREVGRACKPTYTAVQRCGLHTNVIAVLEEGNGLRPPDRRRIEDFIMQDEETTKMEDTWHTL
ncbi:hypothetical protein OE88DRAFT_1656332 [Heliocybe sulcata]|uniref:Uncharacterized protein n=1 Tax=Heliocybe sulcata TaxID=5364 RepID=A0A5C3N6D8_9AGAM|nr:hypothetical protein OE88DRAFT_1656332 [Heliocybe sulcata]